MHLYLFAMALLLALAIIGIGAMYVARPLAMIGSFGLPLSPNDAAVASWLRLKGVRDIVAGLAVLALMTWSSPGALGVVLLVDALIPAGDMLVVLAANGSRKTALGVHGVTALVMILTAVPLLAGAA